VQRVINGQVNEVCGGGQAEPIPQELLAYRRSWSAPEPEPERVPERERDRASDTPPFGTPVVPAQGDPWAASPPPAPVPGGPPQAGPPATGAPPQPTVVPGAGGAAAAGEIRDRLIELDDLRQRKIISEEEFAAKKAELLSRI
jgi:hypothetical protein